MPNQYVIQSALRTLQVLLAFGKPPHRFGLADLQQVTPFEKNQLYRSLRTLEAGGFLVADSSGRYTVTPLVNVLGAASAHGRPLTLVEVASPQLDLLADETGEAVNLNALAGDQSVCLDRRESPHRVRLASVLGQAYPLHAGAGPKAILAFLDERKRDQILRQLHTFPTYSGATLKDPGQLAAEIEATRQRGYSISDGDFDESARGVGAPIFDGSGHVIGAVSVGGPSFRVGEAELTRFAPLIVQVARTISQGLGYTA